MKKGPKYIIATLIWGFITWQFWISNNMPQWYGMWICLCSILGMIIYGFVEEFIYCVLYPVLFPCKFKRYPLSIIMTVIMVLSFILAIYQFCSGTLWNSQYWAEGHSRFSWVAFKFYYFIISSILFLNSSLWLVS